MDERFPYFASLEIDRLLRIEVFFSIHPCESQLPLCDSMAVRFENMYWLAVLAQLQQQPSRPVRQCRTNFSPTWFGNPRKHEKQDPRARQALCIVSPPLARKRTLHFPLPFSQRWFFSRPQSKAYFLDPLPGFLSSSPLRASSAS